MASMYILTDSGKKPYSGAPPLYVAVQMCNNPKGRFTAFALVDGKPPIVGQTIQMANYGAIARGVAVEEDKGLITEILVQESRPPNMMARDYVSTEECGSAMPPPVVPSYANPQSTQFDPNAINPNFVPPHLREDFDATDSKWEGYTPSTQSPYYAEEVSVMESAGRKMGSDGSLRTPSLLERIPMYVWVLVGAGVIIMVGKRQRWF